MTDIKPKIKEREGFQKGNNAAVKSGFYVDNFLPCNEKSCPKFENCQIKKQYQDDTGILRCTEEIDFFEKVTKDVEKEFNLTKKDKFQLPLMIMRMIKIKRQNRYEATKGPAGKTIVFNPKTGKEHMMDIPNVLNRDVYYAEKILMAWLDSLKLSRSSRAVKNKLDVFHKIVNADKSDYKEEEEEG